MENLQIYPIKKRLVTNFKLCKILYNLDQEKFRRSSYSAKRPLSLPLKKKRAARNFSKSA